MDKLVKEIFIFIGLFLFLALGMHMKQWIAGPMEHFSKLSGSEFGLFHPLFFTLFVYVVLYIIRLIIKFIVSVFSKSRD